MRGGRGREVGMAIKSSRRDSGGRGNVTLPVLASQDLAVEGN